jgi:hypothetical protein
MQLFRSLILPLLLLLLLPALLRAQATGAGRSFILTHPYVTMSSRGTGMSLRLLMTSRTGADVRVEYTASGVVDRFTIPPNSSFERVLDKASVLLPESEGTFRNTIQVTSTSPVTAALMVDQEFAQEGYNAIPDTLLGFEYRAVSSDYATEGSVFAIIGVEDTTHVTITPIVETRSGHPAGVPFMVTLNRGEVYQLLSRPFVDFDVTGSLISADKPIGVVGGAECAHLPYGFRFGSEYTCNPLIEQIPHVDSWGREFVVAPLNQQAQSPYRLVAGCDNTTVLINGQEIARLNRGEFFDFAVDAILRIQCSQPSMLVQDVTNTAQGFGDINRPTGDPSMMMVAPRNQWGMSYSVATPFIAPRLDDFSTSGTPVDWHHYVQVAAPLVAESSIRIDGRPVSWVKRIDDGSYVVGSAEVAEGFHTVDAAAPIRVNTYGYSISDAYGYTLGAEAHAFRLQTEDIVAVSCLDEYDTTIVVRNLESDDAVVTGTEFTGALDGEVLSPKPPFTIPAGGTLYLTIRLRNLSAGRNSGYLLLLGGNCNRRLLRMKLLVLNTKLLPDPAPGSTLNFGMISTTVPSVDASIMLHNRGSAPLLVPPPVLTNPRFSLVSPSFPLTIPPHDSVRVVLRFTPIAEGTQDGSIEFYSCFDTLKLLLTGRRRSGAYIATTTPGPVRLLCGPKGKDTLKLEISNSGDQPMTITSGTIIGNDAGEFALAAPLTGATIPVGGKLSVAVIYTPAGSGVRDASLRVASNAVNDSLVIVPFDVGNDVISLVALDSAVDLGGRLLCEGNPPAFIRLVNRGNLPIDSLAISLGDSTTGTIAPESTGTVAVGDTVRLRLQLGTAIPRVVNDTISVTVMPCGYSLRIPVRARRLDADFTTERDTIDFGILSQCDTIRDLAIALRNGGDVADSVAAVHLPGVAGLSVIEPAAGSTVIAGGGAARLALRYKPTTDGTFLDSVVLASRPCDIRRVVVVRGGYESAAPRVTLDSIDFGESALGARVRRTLRIVNPSRVPRSFAAIGVPGFDSLVRILEPQGAFTVPAGDSVEIDLEYAPLRKEDSLDTALTIVELSPCVEGFRVALHGVALEEMPRVALMWSRDSAQLGTETHLYLTIDSAAPQGPLDTFHLLTRVRYDASLLSLIDIGSPSGLQLSVVDNRIVGSARLLTLDLRGLFPPSGRIVDLHALATLGDTDRTVLAFDSLLLERVPSASPILIRDTIPGGFTSLGICRAGPSRFVAPASGMFRLAASRPNPASSVATVEFEAVENGRMALRLIDARGRLAGVVFDEDIVPGIYRADLDVASLPSGTYWLVLTSPSQMARQAMQVVH